MQNMADGAYMEVAEGLSSIFGVSMDAFARVDFDYLAQAIRDMDTTNSFLADNLDHLISGETTTNAEQMKMAQINKFMIEEGLTYVLDNEAARLVQQNMWAEQRARQIMEATYSVEIQGAALDFLEGIRTAVAHLLTLYVPQLKPFDFAGKIANLFGSQTESDAFMEDLKQVLRLGKVSDGNSTAFYQLTTRNRDLHVVDNLVTLMGGTSAFLSAYNDRVEGYEKLTPWNKLWNQITNSGNAHKAARMKGIRSYEDSQYTNGIEAVLSKYSWGNIGKSISSALFGTSGGVAASVGIQDIIQSTNSVSDTAKAQQNAVENLKAMVSTMKDFAGKHSYEEWAKTANKHGISDLEAAMESAGLTEETLRGHYDSYGVQMSILEAESRKKKEEDFWDKTTELLTTTNSWLEKILNKQIDFHIDWKKFYTDWTDYFINHTAYAESYDHTSVSEIQRKEAKSSEDAVYALADALTQNDNALLDPTMQTNALLAQILKVVTAQLNQTSSGVAMSLPDTIAGLSLGIMST